MQEGAEAPAQPVDDVQQQQQQQNDDDDQVPMEVDSSSTAPAIAPAAPLVSLPIARVKRILKADEECASVSSAGAFAIAAATQLFIGHLCDQVTQIARQEKRKGIQYRDVSKAVSRLDELAFLEDVVPPQVSVRKAKDLNNRNK